MQEEIRQIAFVGDGDVTIWLEEASSCSPLIIPLWPHDYPDRVAVYRSDEGEMGVALSRQAMLAARSPGRLWFCGISLGDLVASTDAKASWFEGG